MTSRVGAWGTRQLGHAAARHLLQAGISDPAPLPAGISWDSGTAAAGMGTGLARSRSPGLPWHQQLRGGRRGGTLFNCTD